MKDAERMGRQIAISPYVVQSVVDATLKATPKGATHWTTRLTAKTQKLVPHDGAPNLESISFATTSRGIVKIVERSAYCSKTPGCRRFVLESTREYLGAIR